MYGVYATAILSKWLSVHLTPLHTNKMAICIIKYSVPNSPVMLVGPLQAKCSGSYYVYSMSRRRVGESIQLLYTSSGPVSE